MTNIPGGEHIIEVFSPGYERKELKLTFPLVGLSDQVILIRVHNELGEVTITSTTRISREIDDVPMRIEAINEEEVDEKINMRPANVSMVLNESTGIKVQQTSATSNTQSIRIQGLDGRYTQILKDGLLPRVSMLYRFTDNLSSRFSVGMGYKAPSVFTEEAEMLLFRNVPPIGNTLKAERSRGGTFDVNYKNKIGEKLSWSLNQMFFYTRIESPLLLTPATGGVFSFANADRPIRSSGFETNVRVVYDAMRNVRRALVTAPGVSPYRTPHRAPTPTRAKQSRRRWR